MGLQPLPQPLITAHHLRRMAADLVLQAEALEASVPQPAAPEAAKLSTDSIFGAIKPYPRRLDKRPQRGGQ